MITAWTLMTVLTIWPVGGAGSTVKQTKTNESDSLSCIRHAELEWGAFYRITASKGKKLEFYTSCGDEARDKNKPAEYISVKCDRDGQCSNRWIRCSSQNPYGCN